MPFGDVALILLPTILYLEPSLLPSSAIRHHITLTLAHI
jgi:hypothetical protein